MLRTKQPRRKSTKDAELVNRATKSVAAELTNGTSKVWREFQLAARRQHRDPQQLLTKYMRECLEIWDSQRLWDELRREARKSGRKESEAVQIVREYRQAKKARRATT